MGKLTLSFLIAALMTAVSVFAQEVPISEISVDDTGCVQILVESSTDHYYVLYCRHEPESETEFAVSVALGQEGTTTLSGQLAAYPSEHYRVMQYRIAEPGDIDGDGIDDVQELNSVHPAPLNPAEDVDIINGAISIPDRETFEAVSYQGEHIAPDDHLIGLEYVKFSIVWINPENPALYFMNTKTHRTHYAWGKAVNDDIEDFDFLDSRLYRTNMLRGELVYHPSLKAPNGVTGVYRFEFEPEDAISFEKVRMAYELLAANMPFLQNNLAYYPMPSAALPLYYDEKELYDASRITVLFHEDIYADLSYLGLNHAESFGILKKMDLESLPDSRDVVIYDTLPNEMPRVAGIITTVPQTPLSHVNLRAIQDNIPNAYIKNALEIAEIDSLIGKYVRFIVNIYGFLILEATLEEVEEHYADIRPSEEQIPPRDLSVTEITPLDDIGFEQWASFGVKAANLATLRTFDFEDGVVPDGFAVPFYFYDEFMKFNGFYDQVEAMLADPDFIADYTVQDEMLAAFRKTIKAADMPAWMWDALTELQESFPEGTPIRCRSSTNNEDLPEFSGAGLYDSKTQHPDEGHISKSIKQVYASLWNFRAFAERQFYRVDHSTTAMGVLVHPNYSDELANGVGVTFDPIHMTTDTYYLNTQLGEDLVTNPESFSIPEEILLSASSDEDSDYIIVRQSNRIPAGEMLMSEEQLDQLRTYLGIIHSEFYDLYGVGPKDDFAMEIEFKITSDDKLAIKQARPWAYSEITRPVVSAIEDDAAGQPVVFHLHQNFPNPFNPTTLISYEIPRRDHVQLEIFSITGQKMATLVNTYQSAGTYAVEWNGKDMNGHNAASGMYFYRLQTGSTVLNQKMMLVR